MSTKFAVGDRVRVYGLDRNCNPIQIISTVTKVLEDGLLYLDEPTSHVRERFDLSVAHPKQCRKLKKKEPQIIYITEAGLEAIARSGSLTVFATSTKRVPNDVACVVRRKK